MNQVYIDPHMVSAVARRLERNVPRDQIVAVYGEDAVSAAEKYIADNPAPAPVSASSNGNGNGARSAAATAPEVTKAEVQAVHGRCEGMEANIQGLQAATQELDDRLSALGEQINDLREKIVRESDQAESGDATAKPKRGGRRAAG